MLAVTAEGLCKEQGDMAEIVAGYLEEFYEREMGNIYPVTETDRWNESAPAEPEKCQGKRLEDLGNRKNTRKMKLFRRKSCQFKTTDARFHRTSPCL
jgi:hypothetical protein